MASKFCIKCGAQMSESGVCPRCGYSEAPASTPTPAPAPVSAPVPEEKKKSKVLLIILIICGAGLLCLLGLILAVILIIRAFFAPSAPNNNTVNESLPQPYRQVIEAVIDSYPWEVDGNSATVIDGYPDSSLQYASCESLSDVEYSLTDIDKNNTPELIITKNEENGYRILDIYTTDGKRPVHLAASHERRHLFVLNDGRIVTSWSVSAKSYGYDFYRIDGDDCELDDIYRITCDGYLAADEGVIPSADDLTEGNLENCWFKVDLDDENERPVHITKSEAENIIDEALDKVIGLDRTPINEYIPKDTETTAPNDTADEAVPPAVEEKKNYTVEYTGENLSGNIVPIYDAMAECICYFGVSQYYADDGSLNLIDYHGNIRASTHSSYSYDYCSICGYITNHETYFDPYSYELIEYPGGHGGYDNTLYYNSSNGEVFTYDFGYYMAVLDVDYAVVRYAIPRAATEEERDWYGSDTAYDFPEKYGIFADGSLVVPCEYDFGVNYGSEVCALQKDGKWAYFDEDGEMILGFEYDPSDDRCGYKESGKVYIPYQDTFGCFAVKRDGKWAYCTVDGEFITGFDFDEARPVYNGSAWVKIDGVWQIISLEFDYPDEMFKFEADYASKLVKEYLEDIQYTNVNVHSDYEIVNYYSAMGYVFNVDVVYQDYTGILKCIAFPDGYVTILFSE